MRAFLASSKQKLTPGQLLEMQLLYEWRGWRTEHIAAYFGITHNGVKYHLLTRGWQREVPETDEVLAPHIGWETAHRRRQRHRENHHHCPHNLWHVRCAHCGGILASETRVNSSEWAKQAHALTSRFLGLKYENQELQLGKVETAYDTG